MKRNLLIGLVGLALVAVGISAREVLSQSPKQGQRFYSSAVEIPGAQPNQESIDAARKLRDQLRTKIEQANDDASKSDNDLLTALERYLAQDKLQKIINDLEEFVEQSPAGTREVEKAKTAIRVLKSDENDEGFALPRGAVKANRKMRDLDEERQ